MKYSLFAMLIGFVIDLLVGDPHSIPHPVVFIGKLISSLEAMVRKLFPQTEKGENLGGALLWIIVVVVSTCVPILILLILHMISPWLRLIAESIMCWQILATRSLRDESMKVYEALETGDLEKSRYAVSMIVGRDTAELTDAAITRATVETIAENTADGIVAPLLCLAIGGAPLGFFYKAVNTMDSMLGYVEMPYKNIGLVPAKMDDVMNFIPARISAIMMLLSGWMLRMDAKNGWKIFKRDRFNHASPNSAQTESVAAGLLGLQLAGDAWYHGVLHKKKFIGDPMREIEHRDIPRACRLLYVTAGMTLLISALLKALILL